MQKVLFVLKTGGGLGGLEILFLDWLAEIDYSQTAVVLASQKAELFSERIKQDGLPVECVDVPETDQGPFWHVFRRWFSFFSSFRAHKIILLEGIVPEFSLPVFLAARMCGIGNKLLVYETTTPRPVPKGKSRLHFGFLPGIGLWRRKQQWNVRIRGYLARRTFTMSRGTLNKMIADYSYPPKNCHVLHHGVDSTRFFRSETARSEFRRANGIPEDAMVIISHGRLDRNKRVDRIIQSFHALSAKHQNLWLILTRHGPLREEVEQAIANLDVKNRVKLLGFQDDISRLVQAGDIYVLASDNEGFGIALVEAMSSELVCVATDITGPGDIVADGENGFLVAETDDGVFSGLKRAVELTETERASMRRAARNTVLRKFELKDVVRRALEAFEIPCRTLPATIAGPEGGVAAEGEPERDLQPVR